jgi:hypothetical protein
MNRSLSLPLLLVVSALVTACSGATVPTSRPVDDATPLLATATPAVTDDAAGSDAAAATLTCAALLPDDELKNIVFATIGNLAERTFPGSTECNWPYDKNGMGTNDFFQVILDRNASDVDLWRATKDSEAGDDAQTPIAIEGIGDESYTWVGQGGYRKLYVRRGDVTLILRFNSDLIALNSESTMIDFATRLFGRA